MESSSLTRRICSLGGPGLQGQVYGVRSTGSGGVKSTGSGLRGQVYGVRSGGVKSTGSGLRGQAWWDQVWWGQVYRSQVWGGQVWGGGPELGRGREGLVLRDGEQQQEALAAPEVVVPDGGVVLLARRVQDVDLHVLAVQDHLLPVAVGLGGLVVLHELGSGGAA